MKFIPCLIIYILLSPVYSQDVIITKSDTINGIEIINNRNETNFNMVSYKINGKRNSIDAKNLVSFYSENDFYKSVLLKNNDEIEGIAKYMTKGEIGIYSSIYPNDESYEQLFILELPDKTFISLNEYESSLEEYFLNTLEKFSEFREVYKKNISYNYKSLYNFTSHYNHFLYPDKYKAVKYKKNKNLTGLWIGAGAAVVVYFLLDGVVTDDDPPQAQTVRN